MVQKLYVVTLRIEILNLVKFLDGQFLYRVVKEVGWSPYHFLKLYSWMVGQLDLLLKMTVHSVFNLKTLSIFNIIYI